jgi:hypothetical protein
MPKQTNSLIFISSPFIPGNLVSKAAGGVRARPHQPSSRAQLFPVATAAKSGDANGLGTNLARKPKPAG